MCGIVGYVGNKKAGPVLISGLSRLEYRGYDSSGIATVANDKFAIFKAVGGLENLKKETASGEKAEGSIGIGHTRWATHGKPSLENAHPHRSERFALVHNGIIENELELRKKYLKTAEFKSKTDTEVIVLLLEKFVSEGEDVISAIKHIIAELEGSYALGIIDLLNPDRLYAIKNKSPLLIGKGDGFNMIGSDALAMLEKTNTFYEISDKEFAVITGESINIFTSYGKPVKKESFLAHIDAEDIGKGAYPHYMLKEIEEQPSVIRRIIKEYTSSDGELKISPEISDAIKKADKVYIIACGTSYHAGLVGKYYLEKIAGKAADAYIASEFAATMPRLSKKPLFIFISQSGETADSRAVLVKIKEMGYKSIAVTNVPGSTLSRESDHTLLLYAGAEIAVASTKAYTAQLALMLVIAVSVKNQIAINLHRELSIVANVMDGLCLEKEKYKALAHAYLSDKEHCFYIGRGLDYYSSLEASLKLKEISYIHTEGFAAGELKHGTIALVEKGTPVIAIVTQENIALNTRGNIKEVKARGANVLSVSLKGISSHKDAIVIDDVHEFLSPLVSIIPAHFLTYYAALERGCDIDKPRNLAKSVTVE
jgi:glucosamine--fructose-6-phosphate aminotransferase (isomerizing)